MPHLRDKDTMLKVDIRAKDGNTQKGVFCSFTIIYFEKIN
jgi:hypothetical protein